MALFFRLIVAAVVISFSLMVLLICAPSFSNRSRCVLRVCDQELGTELRIRLCARTAQLLFNQFKKIQSE